MMLHITTIVLVLGVVALDLNHVYAADSAQKEYWSVDAFKQLAALVPELSHPRLGGLPPGGQSAWEQGQMRQPKGEWNTLEGDFNGDGRQEIAVLLDVGGKGETGAGCKRYLLIAEQHRERWRRLFFHQLDDSLIELDENKGYTSNKDHRWHDGSLIKHTASGLIFDAKRKTIGVDTGEKMRLTKSATMTTTVSPNGQTESRQSFGYAIDKKLILPFSWNKGARKYRQDSACWYIDSESEEVIKSSGVDTESERRLRR